MSAPRILAVHLMWFAMVAAADAQTSLQFASYIGDAANHEAVEIATDPAGAIYLAGLTYRTQGRPTIFVTKISPDRSSVAYTTFVGALAFGPSIVTFGARRPLGLTVDAAGNIYLTGYADSPSFPSTPSGRPFNRDICVSSIRFSRFCTDAFVASLDPHGDVRYITFLGGTRDDFGVAVAVDAAGFAYVTGITFSPDFPSQRQLKASVESSGDAFVAKISPDGRELAYVNHFGATESADEATAIDVDSSGQVHVTGTTAGLDFPVIAPFQPRPGGARDAFVVKLDATGSRFVYATYFGGSQDELGQGLNLDSLGQAVVVGTTRSADFPRTAGARPLAGGQDGFAATVSTIGILRLSTIVGGLGLDTIRDVAVTSGGEAVIVGSTTSTELPVSGAPAQPHANRSSLYVANGASAPWQLADSGLPAETVRAVWVDPADSNHVFVGMASGVMVSHDGGAAWSRTGPGPDNIVAIAGAGASELFAGGFGLWRTRDGGVSWQRLTVSSFGSSASAIEIDRAQPRTVWVLAFGFLFKSTDAGDTWTRLPVGAQGNDNVYALVIDPIRAGVGYIGTSAGVLKTTNGGASWINASTGLPQPGTPNLLAMDQMNPDTLLARVSAFGPWRVFRTTDGSASWSDYSTGIDEPGSSIDHLVVHPGAPSTAFVATMKGLYRRSANDTSWIVVGDGLPSIASVTAMNRATSPGSRLWAGTSAMNGSDWYTARLDIATGAMTWSTYVGGSRSETDGAVALTRALGIVLAGETQSTDLPQVQPLFAGRAADDLYIAEFGSDDGDRDGMPDDWERRFGLSPSLDDAAADPDQDGLSNREEFLRGGHPRAFVTRYFAEGAAGSFFDSRFALLNPSATVTAHVLIGFVLSDGTSARAFVDVPPLARRTVSSADHLGFAVPGIVGSDGSTTRAGAADFSTRIESDEIIVVDRTMSWDARGYGGHAETAILAPAQTWFLAEGATHSGFNLFYLLQNPTAVAARVTVHYLLPTGVPLQKTYTVPARIRFNIWVNEEGRTLPALASTDVSARLVSDQPIIVERAMYLNSGGLTFGAGHVSAGVTAPALSWFLAEGATGPYFDEFVLIANPNATASAMTVRFLLHTGAVVTRAYTVAPNSRFTIWVDQVDAQLANAAVSTTVSVTNDVPVIVERAMWWPGPTGATWHEAHNSPGVTQTGTKWALAEGEQGGTRSAQTYILVANTGATPASVRVTLYFEDGTRGERTFPIAATSRFNVDVGAEFPAAAGQRFGSIVESLGAAPAPIVVERAMYSNADGVIWAAGTNAVATRLQ